MNHQIMALSWYVLNTKVDKYAQTLIVLEILNICIFWLIGDWLINLSDSNQLSIVWNSLTLESSLTVRIMDNMQYNHDAIIYMKSPVVALVNPKVPGAKGELKKNGNIF